MVSACVFFVCKKM